MCYLKDELVEINLLVWHLKISWLEIDVIGQPMLYFFQNKMDELKCIRSYLFGLLSFVCTQSCGSLFDPVLCSYEVVDNFIKVITKTNIAYQ